MRLSEKPPAKAADALVRSGGRIRLARVRRRVASALLAERIGASRGTALFSPGLPADLARVAADGELGRRLRDPGLPKRVNLPKTRRARSCRHEGR